MKKQLVFLFSVIFATATFAQNKSVGIGTTTPNLNAALDVVSPTNNQGLLVPRLTTTQRTAMTSALGAADKGLMVFDITGNSFAVWNGSSWGITLAGSSTDGLTALIGSTTGTSAAGFFQNTNSANVFPALYSTTNGAGNAMAIRGDVTNAANAAAAVYGSTNGSGVGLYGITTGTGAAIQGFTTTGVAAIYGQHNGATGSAALFANSSASSTSPVVQINVAGTANALQTLGKIVAGGVGVTNPNGGDGISSQLNGGGGGAALAGFSNGTNSTCGAFYIFNGVNPRDVIEVSTGGLGSAGRFEIQNSSNSTPAIKATTSGTGSSMLLNHTGASGNIAVLQSNTINVARIDKTGKGFFNGGTQNSGADVAEMFEVEGAKNTYEPGDVMVISEATDRTMEKSFQPNSTKVAGVYATKPGVILTEKSSEENTDQLVPVGVIGVIPTKVCGENGSIKRGDLLVTSSLKGHAMKAISKNGDGVFASGVILGKALENFDGNGAGVIKVLVNVK